ncbi:MAG: GNAT family N-acetyltransferase [Anaerolineales bacterium]|nr:GNAT family N-acetyltransferase [Anaerolineales bacterium]
MSIRKLQFPADFDDFYTLLTRAFHYPENPEWNADEDQVAGLKDTILTLQRIWPLYRLIAWTSLALRDALRGYIWEEDGRPVGLVSLSRRGSTDSWLIGNVAVLPEYRRRGIARKLVEKALEHIRAEGGKLAVLDVIAGNLPAYQLYESMGFKHYTSQMQLTLKSKQVPELPELPAGYQLEHIPMKEWQIPLEMAQRLVPADVQAFDPISKDRYYTPAGLRFFAQLINMLRGTIIDDFVLRDTETGEVTALGFISARTRPGDRHYIAMNVGPEHAELVPFLLNYMLHQVKTLSSSHAVETSLWEWRYFTLAEHDKAGFEKGKEGHRMGLQL